MLVVMLVVMWLLVMMVMLVFKNLLHSSNSVVFQVSKYVMYLANSKHAKQKQLTVSFHSNHNKCVVLSSVLVSHLYVECTSVRLV